MEEEEGGGLEVDRLGRAGQREGGFAICSSIALLWMGGPSTLKSASARGEGNV